MGLLKSVYARYNEIVTCPYHFYRRKEYFLAPLMISNACLVFHFQILYFPRILRQLAYLPLRSCYWDTHITYALFQFSSSSA